MALFKSIIERTKQDIYATTGIKLGGYTPSSNISYSSAAIPSSSIIKIGSAATTAAIKAEPSIIQKAVTSIGTAIKGTSTKTKVITALGAPSIAVTAVELAKEPKAVSQAYFSQADVTRDIIGVAKKELTIKEFALEHPFGTAVIGTGSALLVGSAATRAYTAYKLSGIGKGYEDTSEYLKDIQKELPTEKTKPVEPILPKETATAAAILPTDSNDIPMTQERQIIGKTKTTNLTTRRRKKTNSVSKISNLISIFNQPRMTQYRY